MNFISGLFLLFLGLKLAGIIAWSWWAVTAPLWAPIIVALIVAFWATVETVRRRL